MNRKLIPVHFTLQQQHGERAYSTDVISFLSIDLPTVRAERGSTEMHQKPTGSSSEFQFEVPFNNLIIWMNLGLFVKS